MENILLVKIQTEFKENIYTITFCQKFLTQLESRILTIKIGVIFLYKKESIFLCQAEQVLIVMGI